MYSGYTHSRSRQRVAVRSQPLADLRRRRERVLGRDVIAVRAQPAEVGRAGARPARATSRTGSAAPGSRRPASAAASSAIEPLHVLDRDLAGPRRRVELRAVRHARAPVLARPPRRRSAPARARSSSGAGRSSGGSPPGGGRGARGSSASVSSDAIRSSSVSPIPTRIPLVNGIFSSPAAAIVSIRRAGCLVGEPGVDGLHQPLG